MYKIDVIIPTYKPDKSLVELIDNLEKQSVRPEHIIIMNTEKKYWDDFVAGAGVAPEEKYENIIIEHVSKKEFDHGETRNRGVSLSSADYFLMMTQDAFPRDKALIASLAKALDEATTIDPRIKGVPSTKGVLFYKKDSGGCKQIGNKDLFLFKCLCHVQA